MSKIIIAHLTSVDPVMGAVIGACGPYAMETTAEGTPFLVLARAIAHQQLHAHQRDCGEHHPQAIRRYRRHERRIPDAAAGARCARSHAAGRGILVRQDRLTPRSRDEDD